MGDGRSCFVKLGLSIPIGSFWGVSRRATVQQQFRNSFTGFRGFLFHPILSYFLPPTEPPECPRCECRRELPAMAGRGGSSRAATSGRRTRPTFSSGRRLLSRVVLEMAAASWCDCCRAKCCPCGCVVPTPTTECRGPDLYRISPFLFFLLPCELFLK